MQRTPLSAPLVKEEEGFQDRIEEIIQEENQRHKDSWHVWGNQAPVTTMDEKSVCSQQGQEGMSRVTTGQGSAWGR